MVTKKRLLERLTASGAPSDGAHTKKAMTAVEKSKTAFDKAVDGVKSLVGTGSGKVPLLLPATYLRAVDRNNHNLNDELGNQHDD
jgi:hypothetical protein